MRKYEETGHYWDYYLHNRLVLLSWKESAAEFGTFTSVIAYVYTALKVAYLADILYLCSRKTDAMTTLEKTLQTALETMARTNEMLVRQYEEEKARRIKEESRNAE